MKIIWLTLLLLCGAASAQSASVPPGVVSVTTVGRWQSGNSTGSYRVIVTQEGWERVWSRIFVEWRPDLTSPEGSQEAQDTIELVPPLAQGTAVLEATVRPHKGGGIMITVLATSNLEPRAKAKRYVFNAGTPGILKQAEAKSE